MNKPDEHLFTTRETVTLELPLDEYTRINHPEQIILKIARSHVDIGALCYASRSEKTRKPRKPREVARNSFLKQRPKQILQIIKALSSSMADGGKSSATTAAYAWTVIEFVDWADANDLHDCLAGCEASRNAFHAWAIDSYEVYMRQQYGERNYNSRVTRICGLLEATTGLRGLMRGVRKVTQRHHANGGSEPLALHDFAHAVALNQALFDGLCDLVLEVRPFPYKLNLPGSLSWAENHLWLFPTNLWRLPAHRRHDVLRARAGARACWVYDYENGRLATVDELEHRYKGRSRGERRNTARDSIRKATAQLDKANADAQNIWRLTLGMVAQRAFLFLFFCNTGCNEQIARAVETDGTVNATVNIQKFRAIKWRAGGKEVTLVAPVTFLPRLRRFMELRKYLLQGRNMPYLFFTSGNRNNIDPAQMGNFDLEVHYRNLLLEIDPNLPKMGSRILRASVDDYYLRFHDSVIAAAVMGHTVETEQKKYARGLANDHYDEMTLFMVSVSESARRQRVTALIDVTPGARPLEQGGRCDSFGNPMAMADHPPVQPDCSDSQGCLFCNQRILVAGEDDVRKVASAAYVMEQLILGPKHEEALRPSIEKCDKDLEKIAAFANSRAMVEQVRNDVYENENLTLFWADKYLLFLELGIIS